MNHGRSAGLPPGANLRCFNEPGRSPALRFMGGAGVRADQLLTFCLTLSLLCVLPAAAAPAWQPGQGFRSLPLTVPPAGKIGFTKLDSDLTRITFANRLGDERSITNRNLLSGSGVAAGDIDGDGRCDLFFCRLDGPCVLYRNLGNWKFEDITAKAGVACAGQDSTGAVFADIDGDGDLDLLVNALGNGTRIFENDGHSVFREMSVRAGVSSKTGSTSMALADIDGDGDLDLYVANFRPTTVMDRPGTKFTVNSVEGKPIVTAVDGQQATAPELAGRFTVNESGTILEFGEVDALYLNNGSGVFSRVSFTNGAFLDEAGQPLREPPRDWGLAVQFHDINGDGAPDIYVCNDLFTPDRVWINDGTGRFRALPTLALRNTSTFSMGVDFGDLNRDGQVDFFVVDMLSPDHRKRHVQTGQASPMRWPVGVFETRPQLSRNTLQINRGDGTFAEIAYYADVQASDWSWGPILLDVDLDGYEDILVTTGQLRDFQNADWAERIAQAQVGKKLLPDDIAALLKKFPSLKSPNVAYRNRGDLTFEEVGAAWGFDTAGVSHGMCLADLDNDGDLDVVVNNLNEAAGVYRNEGSGARVAVVLRGKGPNTHGIGAKIRVLGGPVAQSQEMICGGRYLSGDEAMRVFAAGSLTNRLSIEVTWRSGAQSHVTNVPGNRIYEIDEDGAVSSRSRPPAPGPRPLFTDASPLINHVHHEEPFDDFARQPLLPWRLSQLGPGVAWHDVDGDGREDLIIGSGKGGALAVYHNESGGGFRRLTNGPLNKVVSRDQTGVVGLGSLLVVGSANYEDGLTNGGSVRVYDVGRGVSGESVLGPEASTGPLALGDIDGDGDLDLFVGGRVVAGRYPEPALSQWLRNEGGRFVPAQKWEQLGLVSAAVLSDLDGDGWPELLVACEWGPLKIFRNEHGKLVGWNAPVTLNAQRSTLSQLTGWWHGVTTGDLDGDGRLDIVASNWGRNSRYAGSAGRPWKLYYGDLSQAGQVDLIEARWEPLMKKEVPERGWRMVRAALPFLQEKISSYEAYGQGSVEEIYGARLQSLRAVEVNTPASMVFFNRGDRFEAVELPAEAQWAPAFGVCVADADGDGAEDVFLSQNFFALNPETGRQDAGRGLWLQGDGRGGLRALPGPESGIQVYGEQRGCAVGDYDADGRVDLAVSQNGGQTRLYHNVGARPGLRVRLKGPAGNPTGVGAVLRLEYGGRPGPARAIHGGSGCLSQDSAVQVLGMSGPPTGLWVRWPGGKETSVKLPAGAREVELGPEGKLTIIQ